MVQIKCNGCGRILNVMPNWDRQGTCQNCGNYFSDLNQRNFQPNRNSLNNTFNQLGNQINSNVPHLYIGSNGISTKQQAPYPNQKVKPNYPPKTYQYPNFKTKEQIIFEKVRWWGLAIAVSLVIGYAVYRILF